MRIGAGPACYIRWCESAGVAGTLGGSVWSAPIVAPVTAAIAAVTASATAAVIIAVYTAAALTAVAAADDSVAAASVKVSFIVVTAKLVEHRDDWELGTYTHDPEDDNV